MAWPAEPSADAADEAPIARRNRRGVAPIPIHGGLDVLADLVAADVTQTLVMPVTPAQWVAGVATPLVDDLAPDIAEPAPVPADARDGLLAVPVADRPAAVLAMVRTEVGVVAGLARDDVPPELSLIELGLDSIMIVELATSLSHRFAIAIDPRKTFEEPSVASLASTVLAVLSADDTARAQSVATSAARDTGVGHVPHNDDVDGDRAHPSATVPGVSRCTGRTSS